MRSRAIRFCLALCIAPYAFAGGVFQVDATDDLPDALAGDGVCRAENGACTLRAAIQEANASAGPDVILLPAGTYVLTHAGSGEDDAASGDLDVRDDLELRGDGARSTVIDGARLDRILDVRGPFSVHLADLTLKNGAPEPQASGGAVRLSGAAELTMERCVLRGNRARNGGALYGYAAAGGAVRLRSVWLSRNTAEVDGGAVYHDAPGGLEVSRSRFADNASGGAGGAIAFVAHERDERPLRLAGVELSGNRAEREGGALFACAPRLVLSTDGGSFTGNRAGAAGGAMFTCDGIAHLRGTALVDNASATSGGAIAAAGELTLEAATLSDNRAPLAMGEAIHNGGSLTLTRTTVPPGALAGASAVVHDEEASSRPAATSAAMAEAASAMASSGAEPVVFAAALWPSPGALDWSGVPRRPLVALALVGAGMTLLGARRR